MEIFLNARNSMGHLVIPTSQSLPHFKGRGIGTLLILRSCWHSQRIPIVWFPVWELGIVHLLDSSSG